MEFLNICNFESKTKKPLAQLIICRIQNLLPENCTICSERYRISINEEPLLDCAICGQGVHKSCWTTLATAMANDINDLTDLNAKSFKDLFNPLKLPGLYYICDMCKVTTIPNEESGNSKRKKLKDNTTQPELGDGNSSQESNNSETEQTAVLQPVVAQQEADDPSTSVGEDEQKSVTQPLSNSQLVMQNDVSNEKTSTVCRFFTNGNCKHGMRGKECKYTHPKVCSKFTQHGTRQPRGCNLGKKCKDFHPKMCINSLRKGECFSTTCRFNHVKGTKRTPPAVKNENAVMPKSNNNDVKAPEFAQSDSTNDSNPNETGHFLEVIRLLKAEILQTLDLKMALITRQINFLQNQSLQFPQPNLAIQQPANVMMRPQFQPQFQPPTFMLPNQGSPPRVANPIQP